MTLMSDRVPEQVLANFLDADGRLHTIPSKRHKLVVVLDYLAQRFEPGVRYPESEVNDILVAFHPDYAALRRYLGEFLSDSRVVEIPKALWWLILHGIILRVRPKKSAAKYASVWLPEGSPLKVWTEKQALMLRGYLGQRGHPVEVRYAMRYGNPSIASQLDQLKADGVTRILILPAYPQYSGTTTAAASASPTPMAAGRLRPALLRGTTGSATPTAGGTEEDTAGADSIATRPRAARLPCA